MPSQYRHRRSSNPANAFPSPLEPGELAVNTANRQIALGDAAGGSVGAPLPLLAIRYFDARAQYVINDYVIEAGVVYRANGSIAPGAFNASNWTVMAKPGTFVLVAGDTMTGHLSLPTGPAAANAVRKDYVDAATAALTSAKVAKAGDTMTGFLTLHADPDAPMKAATKQYIDSKPPLTVSDAPPATPLDNAMWWDSDTGTLYVRYNDGVGAPQWVQAVAVPAIDTSAFLQKSGDTMSGNLTLAGNPTVALHAVPKQYVDAVDATHAKYQRISLAGVRVIDVPVPVGANAARLAGVVWPTTGTATSIVIQLSVAAGVFRGLGDYSLWGYHHLPSSPNAITGVVGANTVNGMAVTTGASNIDIPLLFDGLLTVKKTNAAKVFTGDFRGCSYNGASGPSHTFYFNFMPAAVSGSVLQLLAFRVLGEGPDVFDAESYLNVEWL
jgi:hypothetical protein